MRVVSLAPDPLAKVVAGFLVAGVVLEQVVESRKLPRTRPMNMNLDAVQDGAILCDRLQDRVADIDAGERENANVPMGSAGLDPNNSGRIDFDYQGIPIQRDASPETNAARPAHRNMNQLAGDTWELATIHEVRHVTITSFSAGPVVDEACGVKRPCTA